MEFEHDQSLFADYPKNFTGLVSIENLPATTVFTDGVQSLRELERHPELSARREAAIGDWREVFKRMGAGKRQVSSLEALAAFWDKRQTLFEVSPIVDFYNWYSFIHGVPMGAYDQSKIAWPLSLRRANDGEAFVPLNRPEKIEATVLGEVAYFDAKRVICRYWNLQDCDSTKVTAETRHVLFVFDLIAENFETAAERFHSLSADVDRLLGKGSIVESRITGLGIA
jgi:DNA/RNA-binding domain of Phe-tRNA-synthetase-like protein